MTMTAAIAQTHLDAWLAADLGLARNASYSIGDRTLTRADAAEVTQRINSWQRTVNALNAEAAGAKAPGIKIATWTP